MAVSPRKKKVNFKVKTVVSSERTSRTTQVLTLSCGHQATLTDGVKRGQKRVVPHRFRCFRCGSEK